MKRIIIFTNNPAAAMKYEMTGSVKFTGGPVINVLNAARDAVRKGAELISNPLPGHTRHGLSPYRSVAVSQAESHLDFSSLRRIEDAMAAYKKDVGLKYKAYNDAILADFKTEDIELLDAALRGGE